MPPGSDLALTPKFQGNLNVRYDFDIAGNMAYTQLGVQHKGSSHTSVVIADDFPLDSYTTADFTVGMDFMDNWSANLFIKNLADKRAQLFISDQDDIFRTVVNRPRNFMLKLSYHY